MPHERRFRSLVRVGYRTFRSRRLLEAAALGLAVLLPAFAVAFGVGMLLRYASWGGWLVVGLGAAGLAAAFGLAARYGWSRRLTYPQFLLHLERRLGLRENELVNADELEVQAAGFEDPLSRGLAQLSVAEGVERLSGVTFRRLAPALDLRRPLLWAGAGVVVAAALYALSPGAFALSAVRLVRPGAFEIAPELAIRVSPGDISVERGADVLVEAALDAPAEEIRLYQRRPGGAWKAMEMAAAPASDARGSGAESTTNAKAEGADAADETADEKAEETAEETAEEKAPEKAVESDEDPGAGARYASRIPAVMEPVEYAVSVGDARSRTFRIAVVEPLRATGYRKRVEFPAYTGMTPVSEVTADGHISGLVGSQATLGVLTSRPGARGRLLVDGGSTIELEPNGSDELAATFPVRESFGFRVELTSSGGTAVSRWISPPYRMEAGADRPPTLFQLHPERSIQLPEDMRVFVEADCVDDFGLRSLDLVYRRNDEAPQRERLSRWEGNDREARVLHPWDLEEIALVPGDVITWHLELTDNDAVTGPKTTRGPECTVRFPSFDEMYAQVQEDRDTQMQDAREALEQQKELRKELAEVQRELRQSKDMRWEQQERLKEMAARQEQVSKSVEELAESLDRSLDRMQQANLFTPEMVEKVQQINDMVRQIQSPEFREYMNQMKSALERLDRQAVNQALEQLQLTQQELERSLDRTLEMLKQLQREEKFDQVIQQAERLAENQRRLNEQLEAAERRDPSQETDDRGETNEEPAADEEREAENGEKQGDAEERKEDGSESAEDAEKAERSEDAENAQKESREGEQKEGAQDRKAGEDQKSPDAQSPDDQAQMDPKQAQELREKQKALREELEKLQKEMAELQKDAEKNWDELKKQMEERKTEQQLRAASQQMQQASQSMQECSKPNSLRFGRQAEQNLQQAAQQMRGAQAQMRGEDQEELARRMYALSNRLVRISQEQEALLGRAQGMPTRDIARDQQRLSEAARAALDELYELGQKSQFITPELGRTMGEAVRRLHQSTQAFGDGNRPVGMAEGSASTESLDGTVLELLNAQQQCASSCGASSNNPMARMQNLSGQQESLNQDMQNMMGSASNGQRLSASGGQGDRLTQMAARQEAIRRGLQELQQEMGGDRSDVLGRLGDIGKEMEDVVDELRSEGVDERILRRQERILSRLLTAQRSLRKEGQKEERISRPGENPLERVSPADLPTAESPQDALRRGILRGSQDPVPGDFRRVVESYFRALRGVSSDAAPSGGAQ